MDRGTARACILELQFPYWAPVLRGCAIDGVEVLNVPASAQTMTTTVALAAGDHAVMYEGTVEAAGKTPTFEWAQATRPDNNGDSAPLRVERRQ